MDPKQGKSDDDQAINAGTGQSHKQKGPVESTGERPDTSTGVDLDDYDQRVGDPDVSVKQFTSDVEFIDNRGPLGAGD